MLPVNKWIAVSYRSTQTKPEEKASRAPIEHDEHMKKINLLHLFRIVIVGFILLAAAAAIVLVIIFLRMSIVVCAIRSIVLVLPEWHFVFQPSHLVFQSRKLGFVFHLPDERFRPAVLIVLSNDRILSCNQSINQSHTKNFRS